jgi:hypothetical protein
MASAGRDPWSARLRIRGDIPQGNGVPVYEISRDLFRALRPGLLGDSRSPARPSRTLLGLCEESISGIARTPNALGHHASRLFTKIRGLYPPAQHVALLALIERELHRVHDKLVEQVGDRTGGLLRCAAMTRRNTPCMREPIPGLRYCPSHRHLNDR